MFFVTERIRHNGSGSLVMYVKLPVVRLLSMVTKVTWQRSNTLSFTRILYVNTNQNNTFWVILIIYFSDFIQTPKIFCSAFMCWAISFDYVKNIFISFGCRQTIYLRYQLSLGQPLTWSYKEPNLNRLIKHYRCAKLQQ